MGMPTVNESLRVAIITKSSSEQATLKQVLESNDLVVIQDAEFISSLAAPLENSLVDILLVDLDETDEHSIAVLDQIMEKTNVPVLFNKGMRIAASSRQFSADWGRRLANKLSELVNLESKGRVVEQFSMEDFSEIDSVQFRMNSRPQATGSYDDDIDLDKYERKIAEYKQFKSTSVANANNCLDSGSKQAKSQVNLSNSSHESKFFSATGKLNHRSQKKQNTIFASAAAQTVWVLGASIGGPQAVEEFLTVLPENMPLAFIVVQHIGSGFVPLLAEQLDRKCKLRVTEPRSGSLLCNGQVVVSPVNQQLVFDQKGHIILKPKIHKTTYSPSIDDVLTEVANTYGSKAGAIIFSGMGNDGVEGVKAVKREGGIVWAQDADSCVISAMADCARNIGCVDYSGSPTQLARRLIGFIT